MGKYKKNWLFSIVVLLVVLNLSLLYTIWFTQIRDPKPVKKGADSVLLKKQNIYIEHYLKDKLHFSDKQIDKFIKAQAKHLEQANALRLRTSLLRDEIMTLLFNDNPNKSRIEELSYQLGLTHEKLEKEIFFHFMDLMEQCQPDQRENLKQLLRKVFEKYRPQTFPDVKTKGNKTMNRFSDIPKKPKRSKRSGKYSDELNKIKKRKKPEFKSQDKKKRIKKDLETLTKYLNLTSEQQIQIKKILISYEAERKVQERQNGQTRKDMKGLKDREDQEIENILTIKQKQKFRKFKEETKTGSPQNNRMP